MYDKGSVLLNMIRTIINNDEKWRDILRGLNKTFYHKTVTYDDITGYINKESGMDFTSFFDQYLHHSTLPILVFTSYKGKLYAHWTSNAPGLEMPVKMKVKGGEYKFVTVGPYPSAVDIDGVTEDNVEVDTFNYYIGILKN
jgi:aminopeptidase N